MPKNRFLPYALLVLSQSAFSATPLPPSGGMQQIPPSPVPQRMPPKLDVEQGSSPAVPQAQSTKILVKRLKITGAVAYSESELLTVSGFEPGSHLSLADLRGMGARIADFYHRNGYFVAQAYLPAQDIQDGVVSITVMDGRYGRVSLNNQTNLSNDLANGILVGLNPGDPVASAPLESRLLLLSDLPGVKVKSSLVPGASLGASDLMVDITPGERISGSVDADNAGNRYTGEYRLGATVNLNNLAGHGDVASFRVLTSDSGLNYARASYQMQFGKVRAGVAYGQLRYTLGREFEPLQAHGTVDIASIFASYPLLRSRNTSVYAQLAFDAKTFQDKVDVIPAVTDKKVHVVMVSLYGDHRDNFRGGGVSSFSLTEAIGELNIQTPLVRAFDAETARSNGHYSKLSLNAARLQNLSPSWSLYAAFYGQLASKNLDISEKMELGGMNGVRAYPEGEAYGDEGYVLNLEARLQLPKPTPRMAGQWQLIGFVDTGSVSANKTPWADGQNRRNLSAIGLGINWSDPNNFMLRAYYAQKLGSGTATSAPDASGRFWIQVVKYF